MRVLDPEHLVLVNTNGWYVDGAYVRAVHPRSSREIILPPDYSALWLQLPDGPTVGALCSGVTERGTPLQAPLVSQILEQLETLSLVKIVHPCWVDPGPEQTK